MVTLRIWHPSLSNKAAVGSSALTIASVWGGAHISIRPTAAKAADPRKPSAPGREAYVSTLDEDIAAEGHDTRHIWLFHRLDECRMLRLWGGLKDNVVAAHSGRFDPTSTFRVADLVLAAGRGIDVETHPIATLTSRARGLAFAANVAANYVQLQARADICAQVEHW